MNKMKGICFVVVLATLFILSAATPVYAYLDPGAGSVIYQAIMVVFLVVAATGRLWWNKVKGLLGGYASKQSENNEEK